MTINKITSTLIMAYKRRVRKSPDMFYFVGQNSEGKYTLDGKVIEAEPVGPEQYAVHLTFHDMWPNAVLWQMTELRQREGINANAVYKTKFERLDKCTGKTYFQPVLIKS